MTGPQFSTTVEGDDCVVTASGELDMACAGTLGELLSPLGGSVIVDLAAVVFLDSTTIGVLVATQNRLRANGGELRIRRPHDAPRRVLEITGLSDWIVE